jgi:hypothetical protein
MTGLVLLVDPTRRDVINVLNMKAKLWNQGIIPDGLIITGTDDNGNIHKEFLEDMLQLKTVNVIPSDGLKCKKCGTHIAR